MMTRENQEKFREALSIWDGSVLRGAISLFDLIFVSRHFPPPFSTKAGQLLEEHLFIMGYPMCAIAEAEESDDEMLMN